jgi:hypothetical protein
MRGTRAGRIYTRGVQPFAAHACMDACRVGYIKSAIGCCQLPAAFISHKVTPYIRCAVHDSRLTSLDSSVLMGSRVLACPSTKNAVPAAPDPNVLRSLLLACQQSALYLYICRACSLLLRNFVCWPRQVSHQPSGRREAARNVS